MHVIESLGRGGAEQLLVTLLPALKQRGIYVSVAVLKHPLDLKESFESAGIRVHLLPTRHKWNLLGSSLDLARLARMEEIDIMHAHLYFPAICTSIVKLLRLSQVITVLTFHNLAYVKGANKDGLGLRAKKLLASLLYPAGIDCKIAVSNAVASHYRAALSLDVIEVVNNPVDIVEIDSVSLTLESPSNSSLHLVLPGRLVEEKGHSDLLTALNMLRERSSNFQVTLAGGGPLADALAAKITELELGNIVSITGVLEHIRMLEIIASADIVVVPSRFEGFGLTATEAMALSRPVIVTAVGGLLEIVEDGVSGIVVPQQDPRNLALAIESLIASKVLREDLGLAGRKRVESAFALPLIAQRMHALYACILNAGPLGIQSR